MDGLSSLFLQDERCEMKNEHIILNMRPAYIGSG